MEVRAVMPAALKPPKIIGVTPPAQFSCVSLIQSNHWHFSLLSPLSQDQLYLKPHFVWLRACFVRPSNILTMGG